MFQKHVILRFEFGTWKEEEKLERKGKEKE